MDIRTINKEDFKQLHSAFCRAFSNNAVVFNPTLEEFDQRVHQKIQVDYALSASAFDGDEMIGFILHTSNLYQGLPTAFNGGTGVIPGFRNQRTGLDLYEFLLPKIASASLARILLEVIETNENAINLYRSIGFSFKRRFLCYKMVGEIKGKSTWSVQKGTVDDMNEDFAEFEPSFVDSRGQLLTSKENVLKVEKDNKTIGYLVFQPSIGRISQIAVDRNHRRESVGSSLLFAASQASKKPLTIMNIPDDEFGMQKFLNTNGFENQINQFEMELII